MATKKAKKAAKKAVTKVVKDKINFVEPKPSDLYHVEITVKYGLIDYPLTEETYTATCRKHQAFDAVENFANEIKKNVTK